MTNFRVLIAGLVLHAGVLVFAQDAAVADPAATGLPSGSAAAIDAAGTESPAAVQPAQPESPALANEEPAALLPLLPSDPQILAKLVKTLSPPNRRRFAEMLSNDWNDVPEWGVMMISLLKGEPMGPGAGWFLPSQKRYDWSWLAGKFDKNGDGTVSRDELPENALYASLMFQRLDRDADGKIRPIDFDYISRQQPTPPLMMSQFLTQLLDGDLNGRITIAELQELIARADKDQTGFLTIEDLQRDFTRAFADMSNASGEEMPSPEEFVSMFFNGELGTMESGPELGETAPDFTLPTHDGARTVTLSASRGKPVILIFGSFT